MPRVHLRAREQVIERANAVPGAPRAKKLADQELLVAGVQVLVDTDTDPRLELLVGILQPLALAEATSPTLPSSRRTATFSWST